MADILENPVDLIDDAYEQEIQVEQEMIEVVAYRSYNRLDDKPQINGVELVGNKTSSDLGITAQIESAVNSEAQARAQADNTLQGKIDTEKLARQQADSTLQGNIDAEETARKAADKDIQDVLDGETLARQNADTALGGRIDTEIHDRQVADIALQGQIDAITSKSDVVDVVATYADLQAYDTQHLGDNDVIKVLDDETHGDALTYYRWSKTNQTWTFIGQEAPYYSKSQTDTLLLGKQNTIDSSHKLSADLVDDTSTTNKFVTASDITNWNSKQDALTAGTGIDITGDVISTPAIVPEVVAELPTTGAEGKLYLTPKAHTTSTATGNPIEATITAQAGQLESFQLDGDTFQQSYTGKNLFVPPESTTSRGVTYTRNNDGSFNISGTATGGESLASIFTGINLQDGDSLTLSSNVAISTGVVYRVEAYNGNSWLVSLISQVTTMPKTITIPSNATRLRYSIGVLENRTVELNNVTFQLEKGTATSYEPFVGGIPSPNPSYPQPIRTVTGLQTVSINGTNYPLDLGDIELCGLGDDGNGNPLCKDYIYPDGDDWKVHKATRKESASGLTWEWANIGWYFARTEYGLGYDIDKINIISESFVGVARRPAPTISHAYITMSLDGNVGIKNPDITGANNVEAFTEWLDNLNTIYIYALLTPTDTTITDTDLIAQLEAIRTASLKNGTNTITNTATGTNLAGDMEIGYFGFNPTNRYDKFIWLNLNNNYEQIGGE